MNKVYLLLFAFLVLLTAVTVLKRPESGSSVTHTGSETGDEKETVRNFWTSYREATRYRMTGQMEEAVRSYEQALTFDEQHQDALYYLGNTLITLGRWKEAGERFEQLTTVNPNSARAFSRLGDLKMCFGEESPVDLTGAKSSFIHALEINQEETGPLLRLGEVEVLRGDYAAALQHLETVSRSDFTSIEAYFFGGYAAWKQGDVVRAKDLWDQAVQHAKPKTTQPAVVGEGDRKGGMSPEDTACPLIQTPLERFKAEVAASNVPVMNDTYREIERALKGQR